MKKFSTTKKKLACEGQLQPDEEASNGPSKVVWERSSKEASERSSVGEAEAQRNAAGVRPSRA